MPEYFPCLYFGVEVEVTGERFTHVLQRHPEVASAHWARVAETLNEPDEVRLSRRPGDDVLFFRWYDDVGNYMQVVVNSHPSGRMWLVTAHFARRIRGGELLWRPS